MKKPGRPRIVPRKMINGIEHRQCMDCGAWFPLADDRRGRCRPCLKIFNNIRWKRRNENAKISCEVGFSQ